MGWRLVADVVARRERACGLASVLLCRCIRLRDVLDVRWPG
jgi:hypothetical protein